MLMLINLEMLSIETLVRIGKDYGIEGEPETKEEKMKYAVKVINVLREIDYRYSINQVRLRLGDNEI